MCADKQEQTVMTPGEFNKHLDDLKIRFEKWDERDLGTELQELIGKLVLTWPLFNKVKMHWAEYHDESRELSRLAADAFDQDQYLGNHRIWMSRLANYKQDGDVVLEIISNFVASLSDGVYEQVHPFIIKRIEDLVQYQRFSKNLKAGILEYHRPNKTDPVHIVYKLRNLFKGYEIVQKVFCNLGTDMDTFSQICRSYYSPVISGSLDFLSKIRSSRDGISHREVSLSS